MASVFKRHGRGPWLIHYVDADGRRRERSSRTTDKRAAERIAADIAERVALRKAGIIDTRTDRFSAAEARPIAEHVAEYAASLRDAGRTQKHATETETLALRTFADAKIERISDVAPSSVLAALGRRRAEGLSLRSLNKALRAMKSFSRWLTRDGRTASDALAHVPGFPEWTDRRRQRRELSPEEIERLMSAAESGPTRFGLTGDDRAMLYRLAAGSGLRASELGSLTRTSFRLDAEPPIVVVEAAYSKRRRRDEQPIHPSLAAVLRPWVATKPADRSVFDVRRIEQKTSRMIAADLEAAGIDAEDEDGRVADFHALRHTYVSRVVRSGATVKEAQTLARHADPTLTIGRYSHVHQDDLSRALDRVATAEKTSGESARVAAGGEIHPQHPQHPQQIPQHLQRESVRSDASGCNDPTSETENANLRESANGVGIRAPLRPPARHFDGRPARTRTEDQRIMSPLL